MVVIWANGDRRQRLVPVAAASVGLVATVCLAGVPGPIAVAGVVSSFALAITAVRSANPKAALGGQLAPLAAAVAILATSNAGLATGVVLNDWHPVVAVAAYPFLGRALLELVRRHRQVREADVLVEAALVATAVGIILHVATAGWRTGTGASVWGESGSAFATMLVSLDVALLVIGGRSLATGEARRGPVGWLHVGIGFLAVAHMIQQLHVAHLHDSHAAVGAVAVVGLLTFGVAALHPVAQREPNQLLEDLQPFSRVHAVVVVAALLAAPSVLAAQAIRGVTPSATVATGSVVSGLILAGYLVQLLRDRATIEHDATHDGLTHLPNRVLLVDRLERSIAHARRTDRVVGVLFVDLDRFKEVNDTFGHAAGDTLLRAVAQRLQRCVRDEDTVARLSGDEFVVLLPHLGDADEVLVVADRMLLALGDPFTVEGERLLIAGSVGIAVYPNDGASAEEILAGADAAMYTAKETAGSHWQVYSPGLATEALSRMQLEAELLDGMARDELVLHYQPIVDAVTGLTSGAEALVRWQHPERGLVPPDEFVPLAERSDLIAILGDRVILQACRELRRWQDQGLRSTTISVNVAARHFSCGLVSSVTAALRETGVDAKGLIIELTESTIVDNLDAVAGVLEELRDLGVRAAIDDFGTGYCGLKYLSVLPVATLKIDRTFIQGMTPSDAAIVGATIAMGHSLGLRITAEGIETADQRRFLIDQGCDHLQGYLLGRPMPADDLMRRLQAERADVPAARPWLGELVST
ncbi:MAG: putative bifunctional diguanylate cyclase/phosphodiesterase [Acidimicrobiales bacterium]